MFKYFTILNYLAFTFALKYITCPELTTESGLCTSN